MLKIYAYIAELMVKKMGGRKLVRWLALMLAGLLFLVGCADGVLFEQKNASGQVERLRLDGGGDWDDYDITPRYQSQKKKDQDGYNVMLKSEKTF